MEPQPLQPLAQLLYLKADQREFIALSEYLVIFYELHQRPANRILGAHRQIKTACCRLFVS